MPNSIAKDLEIMFEAYVESYEAGCVLSKEVETSYPAPQTMQRAGDVFYRPQSYHADIVTGMDLTSASAVDVIQRMVPTVYRSPDNVLFRLDAKEMRDPEHMRRMGESAATRLAAEVEKNLYTAVASRAAIVVKKTGVFTWDDAATAEALMLTRGIGVGRERKLFMNAFDYKDVTKDLGNRAYIGDRTKAAYERSQVPDIAGFKTFRTDNLVNLAAVGTVTGTQVDGNQSATVASMSGDLPKDNRQMVLTVKGANIANIKAGDAFQIANVNWVHQVDKSDTGQLATFRVLSKDGANLTITPAIIPTGPYQNVTAQAANNANLTFLNTATRPVNVFWANGSVSLDYGKLAFPSGQGPKVMDSTTANGVPLIMSYDFDQIKGITTVRCTTLYAVTVLDPEQCGIIIANQ